MFVYFLLFLSVYPNNITNL